MFSHYIHKSPIRSLCVLTKKIYVTMNILNLQADLSFTQCSNQLNDRKTSVKRFLLISTGICNIPK